MEYVLVPTARLELAQLSPLPPQDSVSTNFTTSAQRFFERFAQRIMRTEQRKILARFEVLSALRQAPYLLGMAGAAPDAATGAAGAIGGAKTVAGAAPGMASLTTGALAAGAARSSTLLPVAPRSAWILPR